MQKYFDDKSERDIVQDLVSSKRSEGEKCKSHIAILTATILVLGIYFISTTVLIAGDGVLYIEVAKKITDNVFQAVSDTKQPPGYPFLVYLMHGVTGLFYSTESLQSWIISAQAVSLLSKLIASIALYFVGSYFVGSRFGFWGALILSILPDSVDYGSDALSDWPSMMFLAMGFLLLLWGVQYRKCWIFGFAGVASGLGYLVRPECGQVVLYGSVWLLFNLVRPQNRMEKIKVVGALSLLLAGFAVFAVPYMGLKGYILPEQNMWKLPAVFGNTGSAFNTMIYAAGLSVETLTRTAKLMNNLCETIVYYFMPFLVIGGYYYFRKHPRTSTQTFFIAAFILVNIAKALWQLLNFDVLSRRHTLPLVAFTVIFIPVGLQSVAGWLSRNKRRDKLSEQEEDAYRWLLILIFVGISICGVKLVRMAPLRWEKQGYLNTAKWLNENTKPGDIIAVLDSRIAFYAERQGVKYKSKIPRQAAYAVRIIGSEDETEEFTEKAVKVYSAGMNTLKHSEMIIVYKIIR